MRQEVMRIGEQARAALVKAESANDEGTAAAAELLVTLLRGRIALKLAPQAEADTIQDIGAAVATGLGFRQRMIGIHERLGAIAEGWGIIELLGDGGGKRVVLPEQSPMPLVAAAHAV